jgi:hypothetical protein
MSENREQQAAQPAPPCWHKEINDEGICKACGAKAAISIEGLHENRKPLGVLQPAATAKAQEEITPAQPAPEELEHLCYVYLLHLDMRWGNGDESHIRTFGIGNAKLNKKSLAAFVMRQISAAQTKRTPLREALELRRELEILASAAETISIELSQSLHKVISHYFPAELGGK